MNDNVEPPTKIQGFDKQYWRTIGVVVGLTVGVIGFLAWRYHVAVPSANWVKDFPWQPIVGMVVGEFTLITFLFNRKQVQEQFDAKQAADKKIHEERQAAERRIHDEKQKAQADQFERDSLEKQFADILNRLATSDPLQQASAAHRLAEIARERLPGKGEEFTLENYPFFPRATVQLAAALHLVENESVRAEVVKALDSMTTWAKERSAIPLLHHLVELIADSNRTAKREFIRVLASVDKRSLPKELTTLAPFCDRPEVTQSCLDDLMGTDQYKADNGVALADLPGQRRETRLEQARKLPHDLQDRASRLIHTRDALASVLLALPVPVYPAHPDPTENRTEQPAVWHDRNLILDPFDAFLAGAFVESAHLVRMGLFNALFHGAFLRRARFGGGFLLGAHFDGADLRDAHFDGANLWNAHFGGADLLGAHFDGAVLDGSTWWDAKDFDPEREPFKSLLVRYKDQYEAAMAKKKKSPDEG